MESHSKVTASHLKRDAYLYVRQSTTRQVIENAESTKRQYALKERAIAHGWPVERIEVIDTDLGLSGTSAIRREGFQRLVAEVGLGKAGIVMGLEVSRLARNSSDWHRLLEICAMTDTLILDEDGLYDPANFNDRLLLGLKGTMSEAEIHILRMRMRGGLLNKARRGELHSLLPIGLVYDDQGRVVLEPDKQIQDSVRLVFATYARVGTAHGVVKHFRSNGLLFPKGRDQKQGGGHWGPLAVRQVLSMLRNPRYTGAYVFGRIRSRKQPDGATKKWFVPREEWLTLIRDAHAGYLSWEEYDGNLRRLRECALAYGADRHHGPPREGPALLQGRVVCGRCGSRMSVRYAHRASRVVPVYVCNRQYMEDGSPICQTIGGVGVDAAVEALVVETMSPMALDIAMAVQEDIQAQVEKVDRLRRQQVERARYEADSARRRYMNVDAANRLVAESLEAEWNLKLHALNKAQEEYERQHIRDREALGEEHQSVLLQLTQDFPGIWCDPKTSDQDRKRMLALLIEDVTLLREHEIIAQVRFRGGATTTLTMPLPLNAWQKRTTPADVLAQIEELLNNHSEGEVVDILNKRGIRTGAGEPFKLTSLRWIIYARKTQTHKQRLVGRGLLTAKQLAKQLGVCESTINIWRCRGKLQGYRCEETKGWLYRSSDTAPKRTVRKTAALSEECNPLKPVTNTVGGAV